MDPSPKETPDAFDVSEFVPTLAVFNVPEPLSTRVSEPTKPELMLSALALAAVVPSYVLLPVRLNGFLEILASLML